MSHLDRVKAALERQERYGKRTGGPTPNDMLDAIKELIAHVEELEKRIPTITVNAPVK